MSALVGALRAMLTLDSTAFVDGARKASRGSKQLETNLQKVRAQMKQFSLVMAGVAAGLAVAVKGQLNVADEMGEVAQKIGVPVEELSKLRYAAEQSGVTFDTLVGSLGKLSKGMVDSPKRFEELGIAVWDANGEMRPAADVLLDITDKFAAMPDGAEKTALAMRLFGKSGVEMVPLLNQGSQAIDDLRKEAAELGIVISQKTADAAGNFNNNLNTLKTAASGLSMELASALAPTLEKISGFAVDVAKSFANLTPETRAMLVEAASIFGIIAAAAVAFGLLSLALSRVTVAIGLVAAGAKLIYDNWDEIAAWFSEQWATIKTATQDAWASVKESIGGAIEYVTGLWDTFVGKLNAAIQTAKDVGKAISDAMSTGREEMNSGEGYGGMGGAGDGDPAAMFGGSLVPSSYTTGQAGADGVVNGFKARIAERMGEITASAEGVTQAVRDQWQVASPSRVFREIGQFLSEGLSLGIKDNVPMVDSAMGEVADTIGGRADSLQSALDSFKSTAESAFTGLVTGAMNFKQALSQVISKLAEMLAQKAFEGLWAGGGEGLFGGILKAFGFADGAAFSGGKVMAFANGGIVNGATAFGMQGGLGVMGEAGPEAIMPLTRGPGGKLGVMAQGGEQRVQIEITENPMFAARVEGIADGRAVQVVKRYDRDVLPQTRNRNPRERG